MTRIVFKPAWETNNQLPRFHSIWFALRPGLRCLNPARNRSRLPSKTWLSTQRGDSPAPESHPSTGILDIAVSLEINPEHQRYSMREFPQLNVEAQSMVECVAP